MPSTTPLSGATVALERPLADPTFRRALVVINPIAGRGIGETVGRDVAAGLSAMGVATEHYLTRARGDGKTRLRTLERPVDLVVSVGGDGTLREVLDGLVDPTIPVLQVPLGTANVMAVDLGLTPEVDAALDLVRRGRRVKIDVAQVNGHLSFLCLGVGFDGAVVRRVEAVRRGRPLSIWTYFGAIAKTLADYRAPELEIELDGELLDQRYGMVIIANVIRYGLHLHLSRERVLDDGQWEAYLFPRAGRLALARAAVQGVLSELSAPVCEVRRCRRARVTSARAVPYQVDGDFRGETPVELLLSPRQYTLLVP